MPGSKRTGWQSSVIIEKPKTQEKMSESQIREIMKVKFTNHQKFQDRRLKEKLFMVVKSPYAINHDRKKSIQVFADCIEKK